MTRTSPPAGPKARPNDREADASDPDSIIACRAEHLPAVAALFQSVFPDNPLARLGDDFAQELLRSLIGRPDSIGLLHLDGGEVTGFIFGVEDSRRFRLHLIQECSGPLIQCALRGLYAIPERVAPLLQYAGSYLLSSLRPRHRDGSEPATLPAASLLYLGVASTHRRKGIAGILMERFLAQLAQRGVGQVKLAVAASNAEALRFYLARGFRQGGCYPAPMGGSAFRLIIDLTPAARSCASNASLRSE